MMGLNEIIFGAAVLVICVGGWDVVREADPASVSDLFERLGEGLIGRLCGWWLLASLLLMLLGSVPN
jgi:hypothetical protein